MIKAATTYYARVKAIGDSESEYSQTIAVTTLPSNASSPPTTSPSSPIVQRHTTESNYNSIVLVEPVDAEQVTEYKLTLSMVSDFSTSILNDYIYLIEDCNRYIKDGISYITLPLANLNPNTQYYVKLVASNSIGLSGITNTTFTTKTSLVAPELIGATSLTSISATVEWYPVPSATSYRIDVSDSSTFSSLIINNVTVTGTSYSISALTEETTYYYRVRAYDGTITSNSSESLSFSTLNGAATYTGIAINLGAVTGLTENKIDLNSFSLKWNSTPFASGYRVQISTSSNFTTSIVNSLITANEFNITSLNPGTIYYCRVRAENSYTVGTYVNKVVTTLVLDNNLTPPTLLTVANRFSTAFIQYWNKRTYATKYILEISTSNTFSTILQTFHTRDNGSYFIDGLLPNTTYYTRIRGANSTYISDYSSSIITTTKTILPAIIPTVTASAYQATLTWNISNAYTKYSISVYKKLGDSIIPLSPLFNNRDVGNVSSFLVDLYIEPNTDYQFTVTGITADGDERTSNFVNFTSSNTAPYLQFDPISASINWKGEANRLNISTSSEFIYTLPRYTDRILDSTVSSINIQSDLEKYSHLYIQSYFQGATKGAISNTLYTLNYHPVILKPIITENSIEVRWLEGLSENYRISVEELIGSSYSPLAGYLLPKDIGNSVSHLINNLSSGTTYRITLYYQTATGKWVKINAPLVYKTLLNNSLALIVNTLISSPNGLISTLEFDRVTVSVDNANSDLIGYSISQDDTNPRKIQYGEVSNNSLLLDNLKANTTYYLKLWRIISSDRSAVQTITFTTLPFVYTVSSSIPTPSIQSVTILNSSEVKLTWNSTSYTPVIEISNSSTFSVLNSDVYVTYYQNYAIVSGLLNTQNYSGRLYLHDSKVISPYSSTISIDTSGGNGGS